MVYIKIAKSLFLPTFLILFPAAFDTAPKGTFQTVGKKSKKGDAIIHTSRCTFGQGGRATDARGGARACVRV